MEKIDLSVIIPTHNNETVLGDAVRSIVSQDTKGHSMEILIVENGSTDNTTQVAEDLAKQYGCIRVLHSEKGVSNARNLGIESARGEWLVFLDADDKISDGAWEVYARDMQGEKTEIYFYGHQKGEEYRPVCNKKKVYAGSAAIEECKIELLKNPTKYMQVWAKLIRASLVKDAEIRFNSKLRLSEDSDFILQCMLKAECVTMCPEITYNYTIDAPSTMRTFDGNKVNDYIQAMSTSQSLVSQESDGVKNAFGKYALMHFNIAMVREVFCLSNHASMFDKCKRMKTVAKEPIFAQAIGRVRAKECLSLRMLPILCLKCRIAIGAAAIYWARAVQNRMREK